MIYALRMIHATAENYSYNSRVVFLRQLLNYHTTAVKLSYNSCCKIRLHCFAGQFPNYRLLI